MGTVYSRKRSPYLWIKYYQHGRPVRESTGTKNEVVARRMLRAREGDVERGIPIDPKVGLVTFHEAAADMLNDYKVNRKRTYVDAKRRINKHLAPFFGNKRLSSITASDIRAYIAKRMADTYLVRPARRVRRRNGTWQDVPELQRAVSADPAYNHLSKCSPCYQEVRTIQQADAARITAAVSLGGSAWRMPLPQFWCWRSVDRGSRSDNPVLSAAPAPPPRKPNWTSSSTFVRSQ
jgi:hypothetical protein